MSDQGGITPPGSPAEIPGLPSNFRPINWEVFSGLNTKSPRPAIAETEAFWQDGWMPIGPSNIRTLYGTGSPSFTAEGYPSIAAVWIGFGNIGDTTYGVVLQTDGAMHMFNVQTGARFEIMGTGTILSPSSILGFSQWGSQYFIFAKDQTNGYWLWDGTLLYTAGTIGPTVTVDNAGENYSSQPTITLQTTGAGTGTAFTAQLLNGSISQINVTNPGSGFAVGDFAALNIQGGGTDDQALAGAISPTPTSGGISQVIINDGGQGYTSRASGVFIGGGGSGAVVSLGITNGTVTQVAIVNAGSGYTSPPTFVVDDPGIPGSSGNAIPGGTGFSGFCNVDVGQITAIPIAYGGTNYTTPPTLTILGDGTNAAGIVQIQNGQVTGVIMSNYGSGYTMALAVFEGGNNAANATPILMPFGISGTAVEVFNNIVWVANGAASAAFPPQSRVIFSDSGSPVSFSNGGGAFASTDSVLRIGYHWLKQTNSFLYLGGDSSLNYISNVQTTTPSGSSTGPPVTTFNNVNVDPQFGSPWPSSVQVFGRNIVFANTVGIFVSYGGAVTKASLPLDGFYATGPIFGASANFSSAVAQIFGIPVYMLLLPVVDQFTGQTVNKLLMWDGKKWFTSQQDRALTFIATQEINSVLTAWGTDGQYVFPLFQEPSTGFSKVVQSRLHSTPAYYTTKTAIRLNGVTFAYAVDEPLDVTIDNEVALGTGNAAVSVPVGAGALAWLNDVGQQIGWENNADDTISWNGQPGLSVFGPYPIGQAGRMIGMTVETAASDISLLALNLAAQAPFETNI